MTMKCKQCETGYSVYETVRVFGDVWWKKQYCSASCFTLAQQNMHSDASPLVDEQPEDTSGEAPVTQTVGQTPCKGALWLNL